MLRQTLGSGSHDPNQIMFLTAATACRITLPAVRLAIVGLATDHFADVNLGDIDLADVSLAAADLAAANAATVSMAIVGLADSAKPDGVDGDLDRPAHGPVADNAVLTARRNCRNSLRPVRFQYERSHRRR
jgi:hypothetical protein